MSGSQADVTKQGPALSDSVDEVRGTFASDAALQDAISRLSMAGFDRSDISIPEGGMARAGAAPERSAENPNTDDDARQARTLHTSMAASVGAMAAAGVVVATGGAALPAVAAAIAGGAGLGAVMQGITGASDKLQHDEREDAAAKGELLLSVRLRDASRQHRAEAAMREAGATDITMASRVAGDPATGTPAP